MSRTMQTSKRAAGGAAKSKVEPELQKPSTKRPAHKPQPEAAAAAAAAAGGVHKKQKAAAKEAPAGSPKAAVAAAAAGSSGGEIDDLFGQLKSKKKAAAASAAATKEEAPAEGSKSSKEAKRPKVEGSKDDIFGTEAAAGRKRTEEGFAIYSEAELGLGKGGGGGTDKCPFDCDCCF